MSTGKIVVAVGALEESQRQMIRETADACGLRVVFCDSAEQIADEVGFGDAKTLCRVFKAVMGTTAGAYRKKNS